MSVASINHESPILLLYNDLKSQGKIARLSNGELNFRCPFCGDSIKSRTHAHFYVGLSEPHPCYCQRCGYSSASFSVELLDKLSVTDAEARVYVHMNHKKFKNRRLYSHKFDKLGCNTNRLKITIPKKHTDFTRYLMDRLNTRITRFDIERYKILPNGLYDFLNENKIDYLTVSQKKGDFLNDNCLGFLSADESHIIFRYIGSEKVEQRYTDYRIFRKEGGTKTFTTRGEVNLLQPRFNIILTEGIIDLIQIEKQFYSENIKNVIGMSFNGHNYSNVTKLFELGMINLDLDIYYDNDDDAIKDVKKFLSTNPFMKFGDMNIKNYRNAFSGEKDFGVPLERIKRVLFKP
jgi:hypothetical protein